METLDLSDRYIPVTKENIAVSAEKVLTLGNCDDIANMVIKGCRLTLDEDSLFVNIPTNIKLQFSRKEAQEILKELLYNT